MNKLMVFLAVAFMFFLLGATVNAQIDYCEGNFDYDQDQDGSDAFTFKEDFGRSIYVNRCPPDGPAPVPKTGQTECWTELGVEILCQTCTIGGGGCTNKTGQDGMWEKVLNCQNRDLRTEEMVR